MLPEPVLFCETQFTPVSYGGLAEIFYGGAPEKPTIVDFTNTHITVLRLTDPEFRRCTESVEPHYLAPFIHWFPKHWQKRLIRWCTVYGWIQRPSSEDIAEMVTSIRLLKKSEVKALFLDCELLVETLWGVFPKSYIAVRKD